MAGGIGYKSNSKQKNFVKTNSSSEVLKNFQPSHPSPKKSEAGVLSPGQSIEFNKEKKQKSWNQEFLSNTLESEQKLIIQRQDKDLQQAIEEIRLEIKKLVIELDQDLDKEVSNVALTNLPENNQYQLSFLERVRVLISNFRRNVSESQIWLNSFNQKRNKKNAFWGKARNKKSGGQQYLYSGEHSASRSAN